MATNWPQLLNPRACRSAPCWRTADSNSRRGINCRICEKILQTRVKAEPPYLALRLVLTEPNPKLPGTQPFLFHESKSNLDKREFNQFRFAGLRRYRFR